jgi:hypothetical protein
MLTDSLVKRYLPADTGGSLRGRVRETAIIIRGRRRRQSAKAVSAAAGSIGGASWTGYKECGGRAAAQRAEASMARWPRHVWTSIFTYATVFVLFPLLCLLAYAWVRGWIF